MVVSMCAILQVLISAESSSKGKRIATAIIKSFTSTEGK